MVNLKRVKYEDLEYGSKYYYHYTPVELHKCILIDCNYKSMQVIVVDFETQKIHTLEVESMYIIEIDYKDIT